ncbi:MAG: Ig domain-containing protein, partial [bacterium]
VFYSNTLSVNGDAAPYTWSVVAGALPPGISLSSAGVVSGTPTTGSTASFTVRVVGALGGIATKAFALTITDMSISTSSPLPGALQGSAYSTTLVAIGGTAPLSWAVLGGYLPEGLSLSAAGVISGTPTMATMAYFTLVVFGSMGGGALKQFTLTVESSLAVATYTPLPDATKSMTYGMSLQATGGTSPFSWYLISGALPPGLSMNSSGNITGTPTTIGTYSFTVRVVDSLGNSASKVLSLSVVAVPMLSFQLDWPNAYGFIPIFALYVVDPYQCGYCRADIGETQQYDEDWRLGRPSVVCYGEHLQTYYYDYTAPQRSPNGGVPPRMNGWGNYQVTENVWAWLPSPPSIVSWPNVVAPSGQYAFWADLVATNAGYLQYGYYPYTLSIYRGTTLVWSVSSSVFWGGAGAAGAMGYAWRWRSNDGTMPF